MSYVLKEKYLLSKQKMTNSMFINYVVFVYSRYLFQCVQETDKNTNTFVSFLNLLDYVILF